MLFLYRRDSLNALDAATGDGDHGDTMCKGLEAACANPDEPGKAFRRAAGGASGPLFAELLEELNEAENGNKELADALEAACEKIKEIGGAEQNDKTMLDPLLLAAEAARSGTEVQNVAWIANTVAVSMEDMEARKGRARDSENAGKGHADPGAISVALMIECYVAGENPNNEETA